MENGTKLFIIWRKGIEARLISRAKVGKRQASPIPLEKMGQFTVEMPELEEGRGLRSLPIGRKATRKLHPVLPKVVNLAPFSLSDDSL
jgi:hypothetical protein